MASSSMPTAVGWPASSSALRVERGSRLIHLEIELDPVEEPSADPWHAYFAARFAWDSAAADLWRGVHGGRHPTVAQQIEAPEYIEIDSAAGRTAIVTAGLPFHRRSGPRMLDSLLIVRGETARQFRLAIGVDVPNPTAAAAECLTPAAELHEVARPPAGERQGWLFHLDARGVLATHWQALGPQPPVETAERASDVPLGDTAAASRVTRCHIARRGADRVSGPTARDQRAIGPGEAAKLPRVAEARKVDTHRVSLHLKQRVPGVLVVQGNGVEARLPQVPMRRSRRRVVAVNALHGSRQTLLIMRDSDKMHMIVHQAESFESDPVMRQELRQQVQVEAAIFVAKEDRLPVIPALRNVMRSSWNNLA